MEDQVSHTVKSSREILLRSSVDDGELKVFLYFGNFLQKLQDRDITLLYTPRSFWNMGEILNPRSKHIRLDIVHRPKAIYYCETTED